MKQYILILLSLLILTGCGQKNRNTALDPAKPTLALVNGNMLDGIHDKPVRNAVIIILEGIIIAAGPASGTAIPEGADIIDLEGSTVLPGFINCHVHYGYNEANLKAWARAGVTTVRDLANLDGDWREGFAFRDRIKGDPLNARLLVVGPGLTVPQGYGTHFVSTEEETEAIVNELADIGADFIKLTFEDGYSGRSGLPKMSDSQYAAAVETAHKRGLVVVGHITQSEWMEKLLDAGVDQIAHLPFDEMDESLARRAASMKIPIIPTFTVYAQFGLTGATLTDNLRKFHEAGGIIALGDDYGGGPGKFTMGIPMYELKRMKEAGMSESEILLSCTSIAARVCGIDDITGSLVPGKQADILVVRGDPLTDLAVLTDVRLVVHGGVVINDGNR